MGNAIVYQLVNLAIMQSLTQTSLTLEDDILPDLSLTPHYIFEKAGLI